MRLIIKSALISIRFLPSVVEISLLNALQLLEDGLKRGFDA
jgi:hypothetical protein